MKLGLYNGKYKTADEVPRGLACNCICPECNGKLVACKGEIKTPYFSHYDLTECEGSDMTILHKIAEDRFQVGQSIVIPELKYKNEIIEDRKVGLIQEVLYEKDIDNTQIIEKLPMIQSVLAEIKSVKVKPDTIIVVDSIVYFIEIMVTHKVDSVKRSKLNKLGYPVIEIYLDNLYERWNYTKDLSFDFYEELDKILFGDSEFKKWCYHRYVYKRQQEDILREEQLERERILSYKLFLLSHRNCPECGERIYPPKINEHIIVCEFCGYTVDRNELIKDPIMRPMWNYNGWELKLMKERCVHNDI